MPSIVDQARSWLSSFQPELMAPEREAAFDLYCQERFSRHAVIFAVLTVLCALVWWPLDYVVYRELPDYIGPSRMWRVWVTVLAVAFLVAVRIPAIRRYDRVIFVIGFALICGIMGFFSALCGGPERPQFHLLYFLGLGAVPLPIRLSSRIALTIAFYAAIVTGALAFVPEYVTAPHLPLGLSFLVAVGCTGITFGHVSFLLLRSNFVQASQLAESNLMLEERVAERTRELRDLLSRLETTREEERSRIARELHDQLGQELTAQRLTLAIAEECLEDEPATAKAKLAEMRRLLDGMMGTVRGLIGDLRPWILHDLGLGEAALWLARRTEELSGIRCKLELTGDPTSLDAERSAAVFRILQESLTNVAKHAHAKNVEIDITTTEAELRLRVRDDGIGPSEADGKAGFGLLGMRERAHALGGDFSLSAPTRGGTEVTCRLPLGDATGRTV